MNVRLKLFKVGNHWYPNLKHEYPDEIVLSSKIEKVLDFCDKNKDGVLEAFITETNIIYDNTIEFNDEDINRFFTTDDEFNMRFYVMDHEFTISSNLYYLLESLWAFNFHVSAYTLDLCQVIM